MDIIWRIAYHRDCSSRTRFNGTELCFSWYVVHYLGRNSRLTHIVVIPRFTELKSSRIYRNNQFNIIDLWEKDAKFLKNMHYLKCDVFSLTNFTLKIVCLNVMAFCVNIVIWRKFWNRFGLIDAIFLSNDFHSRIRPYREKISSQFLSHRFRHNFRVFTFFPV